MCERCREAAWQKVKRLTKRAPASHTLIVLSSDPETIFEPSGEKATERIQPLWALSLVALSSKVPEKEAKRASEAKKDKMAKAETADLRPTL